jgi:AhpD family alkylhydroperoxidase
VYPFLLWLVYKGGKETNNMKLDERTLRLIAVGASISANCQPCLQINVNKALHSGADEQEIAEAIEVGRRVRIGAASKMDKFVLELIQGVPSSSAGANDECGCSSTIQSTREGKNG